MRHARLRDAPDSPVALRVLERAADLPEVHQQCLGCHVPHVTQRFSQRDHKNPTATPGYVLVNLPNTDRSRADRLFVRTNSNVCNVPFLHQFSIKLFLTRMSGFCGVVILRNLRWI